MSPNGILEAREARWARRLKMAAGLEGCGAVVTLTLRLPSSLRESPAYRDKALRIFEALIRAMAAERLEMRSREFHVGSDGPEGYAVVQGNARRVKELALRVEADHPWGVLADIDVMDHKGAPIGRSEFHLEPRRCLVCDREAALCVVERRHDLEEIRSKADLIFSRPDRKAPR